MPLFSLSLSLSLKYLAHCLCNICYLNFILVHFYVCTGFSLGLRSLEMKKVFATLRALVEVLEALSKDVSPDGVGNLIMAEVLSPCVVSMYMHVFSF